MQDTKGKCRTDRGLPGLTCDGVSGPSCTISVAFKYPLGRAGTDGPLNSAAVPFLLEIEREEFRFNKGKGSCQALLYVDLSDPAFHPGGWPEGPEK